MTPQKTLVLDANILIRAVLGKKVRALLEEFSPSIRFFAPDVCFEDAERYLPVIVEKRNIPSEPALEVLAGISKIVQAIDADMYETYSEEAKQRIAIRDLND